MVVLRSYVNGSWFTPVDEGAPLYDAVTGEEVARTSSAGIDRSVDPQSGNSRSMSGRAC
jgi:oxepin-CoA hydrolase/3-oxo-5,6-dehydrosuberyl-CoA semialdehyde dehydrogenase